MNNTFNIDFAIKYGLNEAVMMNNLIFCIYKNKANEMHFYENKYWTYNSIPAFNKLFPYWSERQIRTILDKLKNKDCIEIGNFNKNKYDRTTWYTITKKTEEIYNISINEIDKKGNLQQTQMHLSEMTNEINSNDRTILNDKPDIYTEIYEYYQSKENLKNHRALTKTMKDAINKAMREAKLKVEDIKLLIDRHDMVVGLTKDNGAYKIRARPLQEFLGQKSHLCSQMICEEYDDNGKYYEKYIKNKTNKEEKKPGLSTDELRKIMNQY